MVSTVGFRRDQLYTQLGVCRIRSSGFVGRSVLVDDVAEKTGAREGIVEPAVPSIHDRRRNTIGCKLQDHRTADGVAYSGHFHTDGDVRSHNSQGRHNDPPASGAIGPERAVD